MPSPARGEGAIMCTVPAARRGDPEQDKEQTNVRRLRARRLSLSAERVPVFRGREGAASYRERIIRRGDSSAEAMREKARHVLGEMERRLAAFGCAWADTTATQVYTVQNLYPFLADEIVRRGAARGGLTWHYARPPVRELEYEMDCRAVAREFVIA